MPHRSAHDKNVFGGSWSIAKLNCVERYLDAYLQVMTNQSWAKKLVYIDAFSGDGLQGFQRDADENQAQLFTYDDEICSFVQGSALRAVHSSYVREQAGKRGFDQFYFIELDEDKLDTLRLRISERYPSQYSKCNFIPGDVNVELKKILGLFDWGITRAVTFIDPYATQLNWSTLEEFKKTCSDMWVLVPLSAITRLLPVDHLPEASWAATLDRVFGNQSWRDIYHQPIEDVLPIFQDEATLHRDRGVDRVLSFISARFKTLFPHVCKPAKLRTDKGSPLFALYFMMSNKSGSAWAIARGIANSLLDGVRESR